MTFQEMKGLRLGRSRRQLLQQGSAALIGAAAFGTPAVLRAQARPIRLGLVTPTTGPLAAFAEADAFVLGQFKRTVAGGIKIGAQTYAVDVLVRDSQ